jgi:hypothetical protein
MSQALQGPSFESRIRLQSRPYIDDRGNIAYEHNSRPLWLRPSTIQLKQQYRKLVPAIGANASVIRYPGFRADRNSLQPCPV